jgi:hypothetical protein
MSPPESPQFNIRADSRAQIERWRAAAKRDRRTLSDWVRLTLDAAAALQPEKDKP